MKTIKVFLSSSCELIEERDKLADVFVGLNNIMIKKGILFQLVKWEYLDAGTADTRTQDDYLKSLGMCDICVVLFWRRIGKYTIEEKEEACRIKESGGKLKHIHVLFKGEVNDNSAISNLYNEMVENEMVNCAKYNDLDELKVEIMRYCLESQNEHLDATDIAETRDGNLMVGRFCCFGQSVKNKVRFLVKQ